MGVMGIFSVHVDTTVPLSPPLSFSLAKIGCNHMSLSIVGNIIRVAIATLTYNGTSPEISQKRWRPALTLWPLRSGRKKKTSQMMARATTDRSPGDKNANLPLFEGGPLMQSTFLS
jgi:hypothetical protein